MKKSAIMLILVLAVIILGCTKSDLPPEPGSPGAPVGKAITALPDWAADPGDKFSVSPENIALLPQEEGELNAYVENEDFIYNKGYIYKTNKWVEFNFPGKTVGRIWIRNNTSIVLNIDREAFEEGDNYLIAYGCKRIQTGWDCNGNKWMLQSFNLEKIEDPDASEAYCKSLGYSWTRFGSIDGLTTCCGDDDNEFLIGKLCCDNANSIINEDGVCEVLPETPREPERQLQQCPIKGDVNNDGTLTCDDLNCILDLFEGAGAECPCGDVNNDGSPGSIGDVQATIDAVSDQNIECQIVCIDSDSGKDYNTYGEVYTEIEGSLFGGSEDVCVQKNGIKGVYLSENYCENNTNKAEIYECPNGCSDGACVI